MTQVNAMKQIGSRNMGFRVEIMEWSNKMDLIAIGNDKGEVIIHRLNWQKIVTFPAPADNSKVRALTWQPDETMIAVGYSSGKVSLLDVEKEEEVFSLDYCDEIQTIYWTRPISAIEYRQVYRNRSELCHAFFLPALPNLNALSSTAKRNEDHKSFAKGSPCYLIVCLRSGKIYLQILGVLPCGTIDISEHIEKVDNFKIMNIRMNATFDGVNVIVNDGGCIKVLTFLNGILHTSTSPMLALAANYAHVLETQNYINDTIQCMVEAWETVLLEMDNKLTKYANSQPEGSLSADFLELMMFGYASTELEQFLTNELTEKGIKKLGNSIELSYSTIQNLVTKPLLSATINMCFFLNTFKGMSRNTYFYKDLVTPEAADEAVRACGAFLMKILELQQIIDQCVNDMKIFFCWLCVAIVRLMNETVPEEMSQVSQEDIIYLADYLNNFDDCLLQNDDGSVTKRKFNLEKVGQYLENEELQQQAKCDTHHRWNKLLEENECLKNCSLIFPHDQKLSLIQQRDKMSEAIGKVFTKPNTSISTDFSHISTLICAPETPADFQVKSTFIVSESAQADMLALTVGIAEFMIIEFQLTTPSVKCTRLNLKPSPFTPVHLAQTYSNLSVVDLQFYNDLTLSLLLQNTNQTDGKIQNYFVQLPMETINGKYSQHRIAEMMYLADLSMWHSLLDIVDNSFLKAVDGTCTSMAVSGSRKVAAVLSENYKKISIYEMEVEDDEDDVEMSHNSFLDTSKESAVSTE
ncbi:anaphase-promoting complex subunit 4 [Episyrphus balteatus]|uniref:anaphase-promoting complex subunit 4 n=1 Tax=Episyrphus balteatus TaxID=286459 RepID=UPI002485ED12|nr:anaphase-promoting complex subunit 4 [Episyrphus balteatus]